MNLAQTVLQKCKILFSYKSRCTYWRFFDRKVNVYPNLFFSEIFLLEEGYCKFSELFPNLCTNNGNYTRMVDKKFEKDLIQNYKIREHSKFMNQIPF